MQGHTHRNTYIDIYKHIQRHIRKHTQRPKQHSHTCTITHNNTVYMVYGVWSCSTWRMRDFHIFVQLIKSLIKHEFKWKLCKSIHCTILQLNWLDILTGVYSISIRFVACFISHLEICNLHMLVRRGGGGVSVGIHVCECKLLWLR